jgi:hypothetical protein
MLKPILYLVLVASLSFTSCLLYAQSANPKDSAGKTAVPPAAEKSEKATATQPPPPLTSSRPTVKLSPGVRTLEQKRKIPTIPAEAIQHFLNRPKIFTPDEIESSGYVVANANRTILATTGDKIYVMGFDAPEKYKDYMIVAVGTAYRNPAADEVLAYEAIHLGDATLEKPGDTDEPAVLTVTNARREIVIGARLLPLTEQHATEDFYPHSPEKLEDAYIVGVVDNLSQIGQYQIVVINKGSDDKLERGYMLAVYPNQTETKDIVGSEKKMVTLPSLQVGTLLVFKVFENVSYALVTKATRQFNLYDKVTSR